MMSEIPIDAEAWAAIERLNKILRPEPTEDEIEAGWLAVEQHALEQGWDDE